MKILYIIIKKLWFTVPLFVLTSCVENIIDFKPETKPYKHSLDYTIPLELELSDISQTIGYQYMFILFPFGINKVNATKENLSKFLELELLGKGYHVSKKSRYKLKIDINSLKANVYDFIVIRKLSCFADITLEYYIDNQLIVRKDLAKKNSSYEEFAFSPKITNCMNEVLLNTLSDSFNKKYFEYF